MSIAPANPRLHRSLSMLLVLVTVATLVACGSDDPTADGGDQADVGAADGDDDSAGEEATTDPTTSTDSGYPEPYGEPGGRLAVGDVYDDGEYRATYLGLAEIPVGPDVFEGGSCYAVLFEVTYLDPFDYGSDEFRPSSDAYLLDGTTGVDDQTGVGCEQKVLEPVGYARLIETKIDGGQTVSGYLGVFHLPSGDAADLDLITIYGNLPADGGFEPEVTEQLAS